jgi:hypothetical protein
MLALASGGMGLLSDRLNGVLPERRSSLGGHGTTARAGHPRSKPRGHFSVCTVNQLKVYGIRPSIRPITVPPSSTQSS